MKKSNLVLKQKTVVESSLDRANAFCDTCNGDVEWDDSFRKSYKGNSFDMPLAWARKHARENPTHEVVVEENKVHRTTFSMGLRQSEVKGAVMLARSRR